MKPRALIFYTEGINREQETKFALEQAGASVDVVHLNQLWARPSRWDDYQIGVFPGGFSYGDDIVSGKIMAKLIEERSREALEKFLARDTLIMGICNGFQVLAHLGLLPRKKLGECHAMLSNNEIGHLESRWVRLRVEESNCVFTRGMEGKILEVPVSNGEGKFVATEDVLDEMEAAKQIPLRYVDEEGRPTTDYPANPSASLRAIAGVCDPSGRILGLMPHPECHVLPHQHPNWPNREQNEEPASFALFRNAINYFA